MSPPLRILVGTILGAVGGALIVVGCYTALELLRVGFEELTDARRGPASGQGFALFAFLAVLALPVAILRGGVWGARRARRCLEEESRPPRQVRPGMSWQEAEDAR